MAAGTHLVASGSMISHHYPRFEGHQEVCMKKPYASPAILTNGNVVSDTRDSTSGQIENVGFLKNAGSVGFNL